MTRADDPSATHVLITSLDNIETVTPVLALDLTDLTQGRPLILMPLTPGRPILFTLFCPQSQAV